MTDLNRIKEEIDALGTPEKLELAAQLWRCGQRPLAQAVADRAKIEIDATMVGREDLIPWRTQP